MIEREQGISILALDFEKAYDRVSHEFMFLVLKRFGFSEHFIKMIKILYKNVTSEILVNGFKTEPINIRSGVRQGCPLSPILFICSIEPLLLAIQKDKIIKGVTVPGMKENIKALGYMDDVVILGVNKESINRTILWAGCFNEAAGFKLNVDKCECNVFGKWNDFVDCKVSIKRGNSKILGVIFSQDISGVLSWNEALEKMKKKLNWWKLRDLTITGKVLIVKAVILPILLYVGLVFLPNYLWMKKFAREIFMFIWNSKMEKLRRDFMYKDIKNGGKGVPNIREFLHLKFLNQDKWVSFFIRYGAGWVLKRHGWFKIDLRRPIAFNGTKFYNILERIVREWELSEYLLEELLNIKKISNE